MSRAKMRPARRMIRILAFLCGAAALAAAPLAAQTLSSAASQTFAVGDPSTVASTITVTDASTPVITASHDIRIRIPSGLSLTWDPTVTSVTITGSGASKVSTTVTYSTSNSIVIIAVTTNFAANNQIVVSGLKLTSFSATSTAASLQLVTNGSAGGATAATDDKTKTIVAPTITEAANQVFTVGAPGTAMSTVTVTDAATPVITTTGGIRLTIPSSLNMTWNSAVTTATIGGGAKSKVSTAITYEDGGATAVIAVTTNFAANDQVTVAGLQYANFTAASAAASLELVISGVDGNVAATSASTKTIVAPTMASAANQAFTIGDAATTMSKITITDNATSPTITTAGGIRVRIPSGFGMTWNTSLTTATLGGTASAKVSSAVSYEDGGQTLVLAVTSAFAAGDQLTIQGLQYANFSIYSVASKLQLVVSGAEGGTAATDPKTITVNQPPSISSAASQTFVTGMASTAMSTITITDGISTPYITANHDIRVRIPAGLAMTWDPTVTTATITGSGASKVSTTVSYANSNTDLVIAVSTNFTSGQQVVVSGLKFTAFTAASAAANLGLITGGASGTVVATDDKTKTIVAPTLTSAVNQTFTVGDAATAMSTATITDASTPGITTATGLRLRIPASLNMTWNTAITTATIGGSSAGNVSSAVTYEDAGKTAVFSVTSNFGALGQVTISGLQFNSFSAVSAAAALQLVIGGTDGTTAATDAETEQIYAPVSISSSANEMYNVGMGAHAANAITITADGSSRITAASDVRIRIPTGFGMTWNTAVTTATLGGTGAGDVSSTVSYENGGQVAVLNVTSTFGPGEQVVVSGLQFANFSAISAADNLELVVSGSAGGTTAATDTRTITVIAAYGISSASNEIYFVGEPSTAAATITVTDSATTPTITASHNVKLRIPAGLNLTWDNSVTTVTVSGTAAGKMAGTASYVSGNLIVTVNVNTNFAAGDQVTISGLRFTTFSAASAASNIQLVVNGSTNGPTASTDDKSIAIIDAAATVSPHAATAGQLPSNGTNYTASFTVTNGGSGADDFDLLTTKHPGTAITTMSITGAGITQGSNPDSARITGLAASAMTSATVTYAVGAVAAGTVDTLVFTARSVSYPGALDVGRLTLTAIRPSIVVGKAVSPSGTQTIGTDLTYTSTVTNGGGAVANGLVLIDSLPAAVQFKVGTVANSFPVSVAVAYSSDGGVTWSYLPQSGACGAPSGYDRCVNRIRWTFAGSLSATGPNNTGSAQYTAAIR